MRAVFARLGTLTPSLALVAGILFTSTSAFAQEGLSSAASNPNAGMMTLALAIGAGLATLGGTYGQSRVASSALEGVARNPNANILLPLILGLAFIESLTLATWVLMFLLRDKV